jgi:hypothetical protein
LPHIYLRNAPSLALEIIAIRKKEEKIKKKVDIYYKMCKNKLLKELIMKNLKFWSFLLLVAVIGCFTLAGCKPEPEPEPVWQTKTVPDVVDNGSNPVTVNINYMAVPGTTPGYMTNLEAVVKTIVSARSTTKTLTINVIAGASGFVLGGSNILNVGESFLAGKTYYEIWGAMVSLANTWVAD